MKSKIRPIYVVSGGKGIAGYTMVQSLIIQYEEDKIPVHIIPNIQSEAKIKEVVQKVQKANGLLTHTMVNSGLRKQLTNCCEQHKVQQIDFMGPLADIIDNEMGLRSVNTPGLYRRINAQYFDRIEAMEFTLSHDDGYNADRIEQAEIILTGVSRAGKTPLSVYMSMFGWKVANVPLVKGIEPPKELFEVDPERVFGLVISPLQLIEHRKKRLQHMNNSDNTDYIDIKKIKEELGYANFIFEKGRFTKIHITNKPIESSANEIIGIISSRFNYRGNKYKTPDE